LFHRSTIKVAVAMEKPITGLEAAPSSGPAAGFSTAGGSSTGKTSAGASAAAEDAVFLPPPQPPKTPAARTQIMRKWKNRIPLTDGSSRIKRLYYGKAIRKRVNCPLTAGKYADIVLDKETRKSGFWGFFNA
jgi:hypothetical protein